VAERRAWWRWVQLVLAVGIIAFAGRKLIQEWNAFQGQSIAWRVRPLWLLLSVAIVWLSYAILVEGWRRVVLGMRQRLGYIEAVRICMVSNLGKYLPGKVWAIAGAALLAERAGVQPGAAVAAAFILQALSLASGLLLVAVLAPEAMQSLGTGSRLALSVLAVLALGGLIVFAIPGLLGLIRRWLPKSIAGIEPVPVGPLLLGLLANVIGWSAYGLAFLCLIRGLTPDASVAWGQATAVFTTSYLVGLIAAVSPGGLGTRELAFTLLLTPTVGAQVATALAIATRLLLTITELGAAVPFLSAMRQAPKSS
jgi:glycosyltransferase 2 family protein